MKITNYKIYLLAVLCAITSNLYAQGNTKKIEQSIPYIQDQDVYLEIDYADKINISYWDNNSIQLIALIDMLDGQGNSENKNFDLNINNKNGRHNIIVTVNNLTAHYVLQKSGSKYTPKGAHSDKVLSVGTIIDLKLPKHINLEFKGGSMGDLIINHNGGGLLASTSGSIRLNLNLSTKADLKLSSLFGEILVDEALNIEQKRNKNRLKKLSSREDLEYLLNGGSNTIISLASYGNITILPMDE